MAKYLLINIDDVGLCESSNQALEELAAHGVVRSVSVIPVCQYTDQALRLLAAIPDLSVGVHITNTSEWTNNRWRSLSNAPGLCDSSGYMWETCKQFERHARLRDIIREAEMQIAKITSYGIVPNHLDSHMGALYGIFGNPLLLPLSYALCKKHNLAFRMLSKPWSAQRPENFPRAIFALGCRGAGLLGLFFDVVTPDYLLYPGKVCSDCSYREFRDSMVRYMSDIPDGVTEIYLHPTLDGEDIKAFCPDWQRRFYEYLFLKDPLVWKRLSANGIVPINYDDLISIKSK